MTMTIEYQTMTENLLTRMNYGLPSFGGHKDYFVSDKYQAERPDYFVKDESFGNEKALYEAPRDHESRPDEKSDLDNDEKFLDQLLSGFDDEEREKAIDLLIKDREKLTERLKVEIENEKDHLRGMKYQGCYNLSLGIPAKDLTKQYNELNQMKMEEEIRAWKDISFLKMKLWEQGMAGGDNHETTSI